MRVNSSIWPVVIPAKPLALIALTTPPLSSAPRNTLKRGPREHVAEVLQLHAEARVGLVAAVAVHGLGVRQARERGGHVHADGRLEDVLQHPLDQRDDVLALDEAGLDVDLRELRLAVGAQVFVAEALGDLEIFLHPRDHEELLVLLRGLRQRVKTARLEPRGHEEVARALGRALGEDRRLDFEEPGVVEVVAHGFDDAVALLDVALQARPAQVEVTVGQAQVLVADLLVEREGGHLGLVEDGQRIGDEFDLAGGQGGVFLARRGAGRLCR